MILAVGVLAGGIVLYCVLALGLIFSQRLERADDNASDSPFTFDPSEARYQVPAQQPETYKAPDGASLAYRHYKCKCKCNRADAPLLVFCHGSTNYGGLYEPLAKLIIAAGLADVVLPDMRGHGPAQTDRGIAENVGQMEDDLAQLIGRLKHPKQQVIVGGHSLGGGFAIRFSTGKYRSLVDKTYLLAPYLSTRAPTHRPNAGGFTRVMFRRAIGLAMLGVPRLFGLFRLPVIQFKFSDDYRAWPGSWVSTDCYNFAMTMGFAPRQQWRGDVRHLPAFAVVIGENDEVFRAEQFQPTMSALNPKGIYRVLPGVDHIQVSQEARSVEALAELIALPTSP